MCSDTVISALATTGTATSVRAVLVDRLRLQRPMAPTGVEGTSATTTSGSGISARLVQAFRAVVRPILRLLDSRTREATGAAGTSVATTSPRRISVGPSVLLVSCRSLRYPLALAPARSGGLFPRSKNSSSRSAPTHAQRPVLSAPVGSTLIPTTRSRTSRLYPVTAQKPTSRGPLSTTRCLTEPGSQPSSGSATLGLECRGSND